MTQRGKLDPQDEADLAVAMRRLRDAEISRVVHRRTIVDMVEKSSYREVSRLTRISTTTLQRWKREAGK